MGDERRRARRGSRARPDGQSGDPGRLPEATARRPAPAEVGHEAGADRRRPARGNFYADLLTAAELEDLAVAAARGLDDEVALLRVLVHRAVEAGDSGKAVAIVRALATTLKVQHGLTGQAAKRLDEALAHALDEIGRELGIDL